MAKANIVQKTGRRKTAVARATLVKGNGIIMINNEEAKSYINNDMLVLKITEPLIIAEAQGKYDVKVSVFGGGQSSQVDAIRQAIARALVEITGSEELKERFVKYDRSMIVSDTRFKEMNKPNNSKARAKRQKSYR